MQNVNLDFGLNTRLKLLEILVLALKILVKRISHTLTLPTLKPSTHLGSPLALSLKPDFFDASRLRLQKPKNILDATKNL